MAECTVSDKLTPVNDLNNTDANFRLKAGLFLTSVSGLSAAIAFAMTLASAKRKDPLMFQKGVTITKELPESGGELAMRALKWGTFYAVSGCSLVFYGIWKLSGATNMLEFRNKMGNLLPKISKNDPPHGRTEFTGLNDLMQYLSEDYQNEVRKTKEP